MIYYLYWFVVFLVAVGTIGSLLLLYALVKKTPAQAVGYIVGTLLREGTFIWFLVLVYPVLKFIN